MGNSVSPVNLDVRKMAREREIARLRFEQNGESITAWALSRGYNPSQVTRVLNGEAPCFRGAMHRIAVDLGIKPQPELEAAA